MKTPTFIVLFTALGLLLRGFLPNFVTANNPLLTKRDLRETYQRLDTFGRR